MRVCIYAPAVMSYGVEDYSRHAVVLVDTANGFECVDSKFPHVLLTHANFLEQHGEFIFERVIYLRKIGTANI
jgi:hypothetical protein